MTPLYESCPRFTSCNAPTCPLYERWQKTRTLRGEDTCLYLREVSKAGGVERLAGILKPEMVEQIVRVHGAVMSPGVDIGPNHGELRRALARAQRSGSKLAAAHSLNAPEVAA